MTGQKQRKYFYFPDSNDAFAAIEAWKAHCEKRGLPQTMFVISGKGPVEEISVSEAFMSQQDEFSSFIEAHFAGKFEVSTTLKVKNW